MNGIHDMGGMQDMGSIPIEQDEAVFHAPWERRLFALFNAVDLSWPARRSQIELIPPADYLRMSYYEKWLASIGPLMTNVGMITLAELESGKAIGQVDKKWHVLSVADVATWIVPDADVGARPTTTAKIHVNQRVRARNINPVAHTRLPRYVRGKIGTIERDAGIEGVQDADTQRLGDQQQHVYSVRFAARELWGELANRRDFVYADMWEGYLEPV